MSATGKLLSLATTVEGHCQSLSEHIDIVRNLLRCYFDLIKISQKDGKIYNLRVHIVIYTLQVIVILSVTCC